MTTITQFSEMIERGARGVRITVEGYMPLVAEEIGAPADGRRLVALAHTGVQNGDVMHDPEIVFEFHALGAEPISFRNDYVGAHDEVYAYDDSGRRAFARPQSRRFSGDHRLRSARPSQIRLVSAPIGQA